MKRVSGAVVLVLAAMGMSAPTLAADEQGLGLSVGIVGGTNGLGLEAGFRLNRFLGLRANTGAYDYDKTIRADADDEDGVDIKGTAKLKSIGGMLDVYPFGGSFRLSVGMRSNKNQFGGVATPVGPDVEIGDGTYPSSAVGELVGSARFKKSSPTVSLGWGGEFRKGLHFGAEIGLVQQGSPRINAAVTGDTSAYPEFQTELDNQLDEWREDTKDYKYWPVIQLHLMYRF